MLSTISIVVLDNSVSDQITINNRDIEISIYKSSGSGGQHKNKVETAIAIKHTPSGIIVRAQRERSQYQNKIFTRQELEKRLLTKQ